MSNAAFVVPLADLELGPKTIDFDLSLSWLSAAFTGTEATAEAPGTLSVELVKSGAEVMVRGHAAVRITMPCSRTLEPVHLALEPEIFLMLSPASSTPGVRKPRPARRRKGRAETTASAESPAKKKKYRAWDDDPPLDGGSVASDTFDGEQVVLDDFVREFLLLDLPMFPVRSDLPPADKAAIPPAPLEEAEAPLDPRLAPLAAIAERLRKKE